MRAVKTNWHALACADATLKRDQEVLMQAVKTDGLALEYAAPKQRNGLRAA